MEENKWIIKVESHSNTHLLTNDEIDSAINCFNNDEFRSERNDMNKNIRNTYPLSEIFIWQCDKKEELVELFENNLKYEIINDTVKCSCEYEVSFLKSFDKEDIMYWICTFNHLSKILPQLEITNLVNNRQNSNYYRDKLVLEELVRNQVITIEQ